MRSAALLLTLAAATTLAAASPATARTWSQQWTVGQHPSIRVATNDAHVVVHRGGDAQVSARVEYTVKTWGFHTEVQEPLVILERTGDSITVTARTRGSISVFGGIEERFRVDVTLPARSNLSVKSHDGGVEVDPLEGRLDVTTGDGRITLHGARGDIRLLTGDGGIDAEDLDGSLTAHTGDGHLRVSGRFDRLDLRSGDGRVTATALRGSRLADAWNFTSADGGITLRIPRNLQALLDATTGDGSIHVDLPITGLESSRTHALRGSLNGGTVPLRVRTADGSITFALSE